MKKYNEKQIIEDKKSGMKVKEILEKHQIKSTKTLYDIIERNGREHQIANKKYSVNENYFEFIDTEEKSYWLGFLYADGYVRMKNGKSGELRLKLKRSDKGHIELFRNCLDSTHQIKDLISKVKINNKIYESKCSSFSVYNTKLVKDLIKQGCMNNKTQKISLPKLEKELLRHFIRGYFDGDGSISDMKPKKYETNEKYINKYFRMNIVSNNYFIKQLKQLFIELDIKSTIQTFENYNILSSYDKKSIQKIKNYFYNNSTIYLKRKKQHFDLII